MTTDADLVKTISDWCHERGDIAYIHALRAFKEGLENKIRPPEITCECGEPRRWSLEDRQGKWAHACSAHPEVIIAAMASREGDA